MEIKVTPAPPYKPSTMPREHRFFLRALQGLREGEAVRLYGGDDREEATLTARAIRGFISRMVKSERVHNHFGVLKREEGENTIIYIVRKP